MKRFPLVYSILFSLCISIMTILMILLFVEYRFFCRQTQELCILKEQYAQYIDLLQKKIDKTELISDDNILAQNAQTCMPESYEITEELCEEESSAMMNEMAAAENSDAPDNDDEYIDESFVIINRQPDYLKQSTLDYMESQELNALMTAIDIDRWSDYTEISPLSNNNAASSQKPIKKTAQRNKVTHNNQQKEVKKIIASGRPIKECGFIWPIDDNKFWLSSLFGPRKKLNGTWGFHHGIDMAAIKGTAVKSARAGTVTESSFQAGYGNTVVVKHSSTFVTRYAHLHAIRVHVGQKIKQGTVVGTVGETGFIRKKGKDGSHLHFEVYESGKRINPMHCLPRMM